MADTARWVSIDPRSNSVVAYDEATSTMLEEAFQNGVHRVQISLGNANNLFIVDLKKMRQFNAQGLSRELRRVEAASNSQTQLKLPAFNVEVFKMCIEAMSTIDRNNASILHQLHDRKLRACETPIAVDSFLEVYNWILEILSQDVMVAKYSGSQGDQALCRQPLGLKVDSYFANVTDGSIYRRKVLSILGLRNLLIHGAPIFNDLLAKLFSGNPGDYASNTGLSKMRYYTGNTVDLDTVVLNPQRQLREINMMLAPKRYSTADEFERSQDCAVMARNQGRLLINNFIDRMSLSPQEVRSRCLEVNDGDRLHVATDNTDRGRFAMWQYRNVGVSTYHVNVPCIEDVIGALLLAPYHIAKAFAIAMTSDGRTEKAVHDFFEDCVSDSCFNGKWKAIEAFLDVWEQLDDIPQVLSRLQQEFQDRFRPLLQLEDRREERNLMVQLLSEKQLVGRDEKTKVKRRIIASDVDLWIQATD
ncbi:Hypothetical protein, putative [Bodo saltans]|uniref:WWE domain-containing protein n=1 Tax=Bodo saltans TaxID=75058 RepID=A0A0S4IY89_BODSA|nr:Hypothetical protein, putative [Bodo saltans]|eukprot:CUG16262.1 Hypothetical protein, putative [Bodo saltans]